jgi:competence-damaged protein
LRKAKCSGRKHDAHPRYESKHAHKSALSSADEGQTVQRALSSGNNAVEWRFLGSKGTVVSLWAGVAPVATAPSALERSPASLAIAVSGALGPAPGEEGNPIGRVYFCAQAKDKQPKVAKEEFGKLPHDPLPEQTLHRAFDLIEQSVSLIVRKHA